MDFGIFLSKLLPLFVYPLGICLLLGLLALFLIGVGRHRSAFVSLLTGLLVVAASASAPVTERLLNPLERMYDITLPKDAELADAIVVLGGTVGVRRPPRVIPELQEGGQRLIHASRLYHASRAPLVVLSGGNLTRDDSYEKESAAAADIMVELGVPRAALATETRSRNTYENAVETARLLRDKGLRRVLLVTSASHMPRAMAVFRSQGIDCVAQPTHIISVQSSKPSLLRWLPNTEFLLQSQWAIKEYIGFFVYRWRGWISEDYGYSPSRID